MKTANMTRHKNQVYSVGNYLMTGKVLGKGHFARVEEATHRIIGKKVAIKIIDLTCIKEEYARRNLHREPRVMAKLRHPCIAALYETMMVEATEVTSGLETNVQLKIADKNFNKHGPRLYVVMEAAGGGDLCAHVLGARARGHVSGHAPGHVFGHPRGLPEHAARALAAQLVSAVRHMHARGVVHRDLKMENIMLDSTKQFIKIVDFGLSNTWSAGGALRTPCGSLEYAAPELFVDGRRYGPEVDLWSIGVIVYGMVTGGLPFSGGEDSASRARLRAAITRGLTRTQRAALAALSTECKSFIQQLLEPNVETRMKIDEAARHRWVKRPGMRMKTHPLGCVESKINREIFRQISELCGQNVIDVVAQIKADPFGSTAGMYNIKTHLHQIQPVPGVDLLWSNCLQEPRPASPPEYHAKYELECPMPSSSKLPPNKLKVTDTPVITRSAQTVSSAPKKINREVKTPMKVDVDRPKPGPDNPSISMPNRPMSSFIKKPVYKVYDSGDCGLDRRLPSINEHSNTDVNDKKGRSKMTRAPCVRKVNLEDERPVRQNICPNKIGDKRQEFYRKAGDGIPNWRASGAINTLPTRILLQNHATSIKRASLGNILSPDSSSNSQCKSERAMPVGWFSSRSVNKETSTHLQRLRRTIPMK